MTSLELTRELSAPPAAVWRAFTDAAEFAKWFWPQLDNVVEIDPRPGGRYRVAAQRIEMTVGGEYLEVTPPSRLVFSWQWEGDPAQTRVAVSLAETAAGGTTLTLVHDQHTDPDTVQRHTEGWASCLDRLPGYLASQVA